jgi:hypothetical protein
VRDCFFLVADKDMRFALKGLLDRAGVHRSLGCAEFLFDDAEDILVAGNHDPGIFRNSAGFSRPIQRSHQHLVVMLDNDWGGSPGPDAIHEQITADLGRSGWPEGSFAVIVIDPELEVWMWQESPHLERALAFNAARFGAPSLRQWLAAKALWLPDHDKPREPKKAFTAALARASRPRSATIYEEIASSVTLRRCTDPSFQRLCACLRRWFPA